MLKKVTLLVAMGLSFFAINTATAQIEQGQSVLMQGLVSGRIIRMAQALVPPYRLLVRHMNI